MFRYLSVCSGIEAFSVAVDKLDFEATAFCEIEDFPSRVLAHRYPHVPNLGDMTKIEIVKLGRVDWLVGGTPCQSFSVAGLRRGLDDDRGNLSLEYVRLAHELADENGLRGFLWENVPGVLSDKSNAFGCFLGAVIGHDDPLLPGEKPAYGRSGKFWRWINAKEKEPIYDDEGQETGEFTIAAEGYHRPVWPSFGMASGPRARVAWRVLDSRHFGVAQRRRRVFVVADFGNGFDPATVLFEPRGQGWCSASGGAARQDVAGTISARPTGEGGLGTDMELGGGLQTWPAQIAPTLNAHFGDKMGLENQHALNGAGLFVPHQNPVATVFDTTQITSKENGSNPQPGDPSHPLASSAHPPAVVFSIMPQNSGKDFKAREVDVLQPLMAGGPGHGNQGGDVIVQSLALRGREGGNMAELGGDQANALRGADGGSSAPMALAGPQVRRLTPEECEKLQGFPVGWTRIPGLSGWRALGDDEDADELRAAGMEVKTNKKTGKSRVNDPDGPRYKALGNSFTTEPVNWIMSRVQASLRGEPMPRWQPMQLWSKSRP